MDRFESVNPIKVRKESSSGLNLLIPAYGIKAKRYATAYLFAFTINL